MRPAFATSGIGHKPRAKRIFLAVVSLAAFWAVTVRNGWASAGDVLILRARFWATLWQRLQGPVFLLILLVVFMMFLVLALRRGGTVGLRSITARSIVLSILIHLILLFGLNSMVISQRILQTIRDPEFEILVDSENLAEEKVSLGIREQVAALPLAESALSVSPQQADLPVPKTEPAQQVPVVPPGRVEGEIIEVPADMVEPRPQVAKEPTVAPAARPAADFRVEAPKLVMQQPKVEPPARQAEQQAPMAAMFLEKAVQPIEIGPRLQPARAELPARAPPRLPESAVGDVPAIAVAGDRMASLAAPAGVRSGNTGELIVPRRSLLPRPSPKPVLPPFTAEEMPALEEPYKLRQPERRARVIEKLGGTTETEVAVQKALKWLAAHQSADGRWDIDGFDAWCGQCGGPGSAAGQDVAATALSTLAFLGAGHTHRSDGPYRETVARGLAWLTAQEKEGGNLTGDGNMYDHGMATIVLAEAYGMTRDSALRPVLERALQFIVSAQNTEMGGWRYFPRLDSDTSVFGWQVMALRSAVLSGLAIPAKTLDAAGRWLDRVGSGKDGGLYGYQGKSDGPSAAMVAEGMFCRQLLGRQPIHPSMEESAQYVSRQLPGRDEANFYYWYYGTMALFQHQGPLWDEWNRAMRKELLSTQETKAGREGSWQPRGRWAKESGRVVTTALAALCLEVYYRYLPLYGPLVERTVAEQSK